VAGLVDATNHKVIGSNTHEVTDLTIHTILPAELWSSGRLSNKLVARIFQPVRGGGGVTDGA
jgi:hypothetical protein